MGNEIESYDVPFEDLDAELDFIGTSDLHEIEEGIHKIEATSDLLALAQGIAIIKIEREELWRQDGYENLRSYRVAQAERLQMPASTVSGRRRVAEGYIDNRKLLAHVPLAGNVRKLALLEDALRLHDRREVLAHFKADSLRAFEEWVSPKKRLLPELPDVELSVKDDEILLDGTPLLSFDDELADEERDFIAKGLRDLYRARRGGCIAHVVPCYDEGEARKVDNDLKKLRAQK
jgi:hypothetical protein